MMTPEFIKAYKGLNPAQKEAVDTIEGPVMVIAGPGTGKTQILTLRIANILQQTDTPPNGILALTFTEAGQKAMRLKLRQFIGSRADEVAVYTYHGFASAVIAEWQDHFSHLSRAKQLTEVEAESLIREILAEKKFNKLRPLGDPDFYVGKIIKTISDYRKEAWTPTLVRKNATEQIEFIKQDESAISSRGATKGQLKAEALKRIEKAERTILLAEVYQAYEDKKRTERKIDFDDLIFELLETLEKDELLLRLLQEKYLYLLVDEHQDTNDAQNLLIKKIADFFDEPNLFVVGDEKQAIYRFQGASVQNFLKFQHLWPTMKVISLIANYRSQQGILDASFGMIEKNYGEGEHLNPRIKLKSAKAEAPRPIDIVTAGNTEAGEQYLVQAVKNILTQDQQKTIAIITRTNRDVERALSLLEHNGLSATAERGTDIFSHPLGRLYFQLLEFLADPSQIEALAQTLTAGLWALDFHDSTLLIRQIRSGQMGEVTQKIPVLAELRKNLTEAGAIEFVINAGEKSGLTKLATKNPLAVEVWRSIVALAQDLAQQKMIEDPRALIAELLAYRQTAETRSLKISAGASDAQVRIMTAHGSKGLEYDQVFLPYATEESWMSKHRGNYFILPVEKEEGDEVSDARRLFYVALTRAKDHATIIFSLEDNLKRTLTPLRFIAELDSTNISRIELPALTDFSTQNSNWSAEIKNQTELIEYAKNTLLEKGLSVTALNHFCDCPSKFFYKSILKLPEPPASSAEKGNAMHEAISLVWSELDKNVASITANLKKGVQDYFVHSLLPRSEKEMILDELLLNAPKVATALEEHFSTKGQVSSEKWVETFFQTKYLDRPIELKLHGKMDALVETADKVLVFDYKTKEAMSVGAIKGETKNDNGGYFRQLVFYKILMTGSHFYRGKTIEPALVFVKPDSKGRCPTIQIPIESADIERVKKEIQNLIDDVWSGKILTKTCTDLECEFCQWRNLTSVS